MAALVKLESFQGSRPERFNLPAPPEDIIDCSHSSLQLSELPVWYLADIQWSFLQEDMLLRRRFTPSAKVCTAVFYYTRSANFQIFTGIGLISYNAAYKHFFCAV